MTTRLLLAAHSELKRLARARTVIQPLLDTAILADRRRTVHALAYVENLLTSREEQLTIRIAALAHRTDLPQHEREISAEALAALDLGIAQVKAGQTVELTLGARRVACPECLAPVGEVCRRMNGKLEPGHCARPHSRRRQLAKELP